MKINEIINLFNNNSKKDIQNKFKDKVIVTILDSNDLYSHKETGKFNFEDFNKNPHNYISNFINYVK